MVKNRIRERREELGKTSKEMATHIGLSLEAYYDLEAYDGEVWSVLSIREVRLLCEALCLRFDELFCSVEPPHKLFHPLESPCNYPLAMVTSLDTLAQKITQDITTRGQNIEQWSTFAGWDVSHLLQSPESGWELPIDCFRDICQTCHVEWFSLLQAICSPVTTKERGIMGPESIHKERE